MTVDQLINRLSLMDRNLPVTVYDRRDDMFKNVKDVTYLVHDKEVEIEIEK